MKNRRLLLIEWEDSRQPIQNWVRLDDVDSPSSVMCISVGWLIHDGKQVKSIASNLGDFDDEESAQACGIIQIPVRCIVRMVDIAEPELTSFS
jgi:hypothetical protein